jgi:hypothetical protein
VILAGSTQRKAVREGYAPAPFFFRDTYQANAQRWVAWSGMLDDMKHLFYRILSFFPEDVLVLVKTEKEGNGKGEDNWQRYHGACRLSDLITAIREHEACVFEDGGIQLFVRVGTGDYFGLDEHGILYLYGDDEGLPDFFREMGFQEGKQPLIFDAGHWHGRPPNATAEAKNMIAQLALTPA